MLTSVLKTNKHKSKVFFFNTCKITTRNILQILEFKDGSLPTKYLDLALAEFLMRQICQTDLLDKMKSKLNCWNLCSLNFPIRLTLVKFMFQAMPLYIFSVLISPKAVIFKIIILQCTFSWGGPKEHKKMVIDRLELSLFS